MSLGEYPKMTSAAVLYSRILPSISMTMIASRDAFKTVESRLLIICVSAPLRSLIWLNLNRKMLETSKTPIVTVVKTAKRSSVLAMSRRCLSENSTIVCKPKTETRRTCGLMSSICRAKTSKLFFTTAGPPSTIPAQCSKKLWMVEKDALVCGSWDSV